MATSLALRRTLAVLAMCIGAWAWVQAARTQADPAVDSLAPWERLADDGLHENRGIARLDRVGRRWALTVMCDGVHSTYIEEPLDVDLEPLVGRFVAARYRWVEQPVPDAQCVMAPCDVTERVVALEQLVSVQASAASADASARQCAPDRE